MLIILIVPSSSYAFPRTMSRARSRVPRGRAHRGNYVHEAFLEMILRIARLWRSVRRSVRLCRSQLDERAAYQSPAAAQDSARNRASLIDQPHAPGRISTLRSASIASIASIASRGEEHETRGARDAHRSNDVRSD